MKIGNTNINLGATYHKERHLKEKEHDREWRDDNRKNANPVKAACLQISPKCQKNEEERIDPKLMEIIRALEALTGKKIVVEDFNPDGDPEQAAKIPVQVQTQERAGWGVEYSYEKTQTDFQSLYFSAEGNVTTEDGKKIDFKLSLSMKSLSIRHESFTLKAGDALIDPLVINFKGGAVTFSDVRHNLDLDLDGIKEKFNFVAPNSGFLTLDKNGDGIVNDGSELFGPNASDGFEDLRQYDEDGNHWINENDTVFDKLRIWTKDENGNENFYTLKSVGIGALYLQSVDTPFDFQSGKVAQSSIFLREKGDAGLISEVDLRV